MAGEFDMGRMQEEAIRRAREMQSRAKVPPLRRPGRPAEPPRGEPDTSGAAQVQSSESPLQEPPLLREPAQEVASREGGIFESLFQDKERTIILALLILLGSEGGNHELMFALLFLLM